MPRVEFGGGGSRPVRFFSDSLAVAGNAANLGIVNSLNWFQVITNWDTPFNNPNSFPSCRLGSALSGGGGFGLAFAESQTGANPLYTVQMGIIPKVLLASTPYYTAAQKFVQWTFNAVVAGFQGGVGFVNFENNSGIGVAGNTGDMALDATYIRIDLGTLRRSNSGAAPVQLHAAVAELQNDVFRLSMDNTTAGQISWTYTKNGTVQYTQVDNAANRFNGNGFPIIFGNMNVGGVGEFKNFSTGVGL